MPHEGSGSENLRARNIDLKIEDLEPAAYGWIVLSKTDVDRARTDIFAMDDTELKTGFERQNEKKRPNESAEAFSQILRLLPRQNGREPLSEYFNAKSSERMMAGNHNL